MSEENDLGNDLKKQQKVIEMIRCKVYSIVLVRNTVTQSNMLKMIEDHELHSRN